MDEPLKLPAEIADSPSETGQQILGKSVIATEASLSNSNLDLTNHVRNLVTEALADNTDLARVREINALISQLLTNPPLVPLSAPAVSAESAVTMRRALRQSAVDSYREEYKEFSDVWKSLETKAQATVTVAGIFIAAAFAFAKDLAPTRLDFFGNLFLGAAIILLIPTIILSVLVLWRRTVKSIPSGEAVEQWADAIADTTDDDLPERTRRFLDQQSAVWKETISSTRDAISKKEELLHAAQLLLLMAIGAAAVVTLKLLKV